MGQTKENLTERPMTLAEQLSDLIGRAYMRGSLEAAKWLDPVSDRVREKDIPDWLRRQGLDRKVFNRLKREGRIKPFKASAALNTPNYYSAAEMFAAFDDYSRASMSLNTQETERMREGLERERRLPC
ncbi:MAG: hypothetical protein LUC33_05070 [Prevotellaceae bacterium]|nr:hypothetical protein [Prevotellaceae bacterium]